MERKYVLTTRGDWKELKGKLKLKFDSLTEGDLESGDRTFEEMMSGIHIKLSKTRQEMIRILNRL